MSRSETRANILLVDDTPNNIRLLSAMLIDQGYEVRRVINGQMALKTAQAHPPDLILLDIKMPDMNGYEVCQHLKTATDTKDIPVIFISALDEVLDKVKAFAVGGVDYITKPFSEEEVFARVENVLTVRRLQRRLQEQTEDLEQEKLQRQQIEEQLKRQQAIDHFFQTNPILGLFKVRIDGLVLEANQRLVEMLGYSVSADVIEQVSLFHHYNDINDQKHQLTELQNTSQGISSKTQFRKCDGSQFWGQLFLKLNPQDSTIDGFMIEMND